MESLMVVVSLAKGSQDSQEAGGEFAEMHIDQISKVSKY
jgi:hypothetical protein